MFYELDFGDVLKRYDIGADGLVLLTVEADGVRWSKVIGRLGA